MQVPEGRRRSVGSTRALHRAMQSVTGRRLGFAASAAIFLLGAVVPVHSASEDPFAAAVPQRDNGAPEGLRATGGDQLVSETSGAASYTWPIEVPPGRGGIQPHLALSYSSQGALRGGIAVGFTLELPTIERDTSRTRDVVYRLRGLGSDQRLIPVTGDGGAGQTYRPELDQGFTRVQVETSQLNARHWTVRTPDGMTRRFQAHDSATDFSTRWHLTRESDAFGNEAVYTWSKYTSPTGYVDFSLARIEYTSNPRAGLLPHAQVDFVYAAVEACPGSSVPVGARTDHHFGSKRLFGARRLTTVVTSVRPTQGGALRTARRHTLTYDADALSCAVGTPPLRYLTRLDAIAYAPDGVATSAPPVTLGYGPKDRGLSAVALGDIGPGEYGTAKGATSGLMDLNGDGRIDRVWVDVNPANKRCRLHYRRGRRGGSFETTEVAMDLATAAWEHGAAGPGPAERCTLGGQQFRRAFVVSQVDCSERSGFVSYHFMDVDGDGLVDLLTNVWTRGLWSLDEWSQAEVIGGDFPPLSTFTRSRTTTRPRPATSRTSARMGSSIRASLQTAAPGSARARSGRCRTGWAAVRTTASATTAVAAAMTVAVAMAMAVATTTLGRANCRRSSPSERRRAAARIAGGSCATWPAR